VVYIVFQVLLRHWGPKLRQKDMSAPIPMAVSPTDASTLRITHPGTWLQANEW
jgi:hypothetical protein